MKIATKKYSYGIVVGRFQTDILHAAHLDLIQTVLDKHPKVAIFLGVSPVVGTINNPLPFAPRRQMIQEAFPHSKYPNLYVGYINDTPSNEEWSRNLDRLIKDQLGVGDKALLYGSRSSFINNYLNGAYPTCELESENQVSGTEIRARIALAPQSDPVFRAGCIWSSFQRYPVAFSTVDIAVINKKEQQILMARKPNESKYRFVGGFTDPNSDNDEEDAMRELYEETGLTAMLKFVGSKKILDWRYQGERDKIRTHLYIGYYNHGCAKANDDIAETRWFHMDNIDLSYVESVHHDLYRMVAKYILENDGLMLNIEPKDRILTA